MHQWREKNDQDGLEKGRLLLVSFPASNNKILFGTGPSLHRQDQGVVKYWYFTTLLYIPVHWSPRTRVRSRYDCTNAGLRGNRHVSKWWSTLFEFCMVVVSPDCIRWKRAPATITFYQPPVTQKKAESSVQGRRKKHINGIKKVMVHRQKYSLKIIILAAVGFEPTPPERLEP